MDPYLWTCLQTDASIMFTSVRYIMMIFDSNLVVDVEKAIGFSGRNTYLTEIDDSPVDEVVTVFWSVVPNRLKHSKMSGKEQKSQLHCLSQWRGEPKISTALAPRSVDVSIVKKKKKKVSKNNHRAGTAQRGAPIF